MADYRKLVPHIAKWEGGEANDKDDRGGHTMRGVTYATYLALCKKVLGVEPTMAGFLALTPQQVEKFIKYYWDQVKGDQIKSQAVAELIADWYWGSGKYGVIGAQQVLKLKFKKDLVSDGIFGPITLAAVNSVPEKQLHDALQSARLQYLKRITEKDPSQLKFLNGWLNRAQSLYDKNKDLVKTSLKIGAGVWMVSAAGVLIYLYSKNSHSKAA